MLLLGHVNLDQRFVCFWHRVGMTRYRALLFRFTSVEFYQKCCFWCHIYAWYLRQDTLKKHIRSVHDSWAWWTECPWNSRLSDTNMCCRPQQNVQCIFLRRRRSHLRWILGNGLRYMICSAAHIASDACRLSEGSAWAGAGLATFLMIMKWLTFENSPITGHYSWWVHISEPWLFQCCLYIERIIYRHSISNSDQRLHGTTFVVYK